MSPIIRLLGPGDASVLDNVAPSVFDNAIDPRWMAEFLSDPRHHLAGAIDEGRVVGMASAVHYVQPDKAKRYRFMAYTDRGTYTETEAKVGDGSVDWGLRIPEFGEVRYTIRLNEKGQWCEIGEVSQNGKDWRKFFEMTLDRVTER
jgi:hypothetical protein